MSYPQKSVYDVPSADMTAVLFAQGAFGVDGGVSDGIEDESLTDMLIVTIEVDKDAVSDMLMSPAVDELPGGDGSPRIAASYPFRGVVLVIAPPIKRPQVEDATK